MPPEYTGAGFGGHGMNIQQIDPARILVSLKEKDLEKFGTNLEMIEKNDAHSRLFLNRLLSVIQTQTGIELKGKRLVIEAMRYDGGCLLMIYIHQQRKRRVYRIKNRSAVILARFENAGQLLSCCEALGSSGESLPRSSLFSCKSGFILCIGPALISTKIRMILKEYSYTVTAGKSLLNVVDDKYRLVGRGNIIERIFNAVSKYR